LLFKIPEHYDLLTRYESMAIELGNQALLGAFYSRVGHCQFGLGRFDQAIKMTTKGAELCETAGNAEDAGFAYTWLEWSHLYRGDFDRVLAVKEDLLRTMEQRFNLRWFVMGLCAASRAYVCLGRWDEAVKEGEKALSVAQEFSDNSAICFAARDLSIAHTSKGDLARAVEYEDLMFQKAPTPADKAWAQRTLGWSLCRAGETKRGIELLTAALPIFQAGRWISAVIPISCTLGEGYWLAGEENKARQTLEEGLEMAEHCGAKYYIGWAHRLLGELALKTNADEAAHHLEKSIAVLREIKAENELALAHAGYGRLHKRQGKLDQSREYLTKALEIFDRLGTLIEPDRVRRELAELS
jgi:tetratricopeptide (TPR) repeat protein